MRETHLERETVVALLRRCGNKDDDGRGVIELVVDVCNVVVRDAGDASETLRGIAVS